MKTRNALGNDSSWLARCISGVTAVLLGATASISPSPTSARGTPDTDALQMIQHELRVNGLTRSYSAYAPSEQPPDRYPLVMVLHGQGGNAQQVVNQGNWLSLAMRKKFVLVAPNGVLKNPERRESFLLDNRRSWNAGPNSDSPAERQGIDDVAFLRAVVLDTGSKYRLSSHQRFLTGFSNGAAMAFRAGVELNDVFTAIAPVSNSLLVPTSNRLLPSLLLIWGDADPLNPLSGGEVVRSGRRVVRPSGYESLRAWSDAVGCSGHFDTVAISPATSLTSAKGCPGNKTAQMLVVRGLGHQWPGGKVTMKVLAGPGSDEVDATLQIYDFFSRLPGNTEHPRPNPHRMSLGQAHKP